MRLAQLQVRTVRRALFGLLFLVSLTGVRGQAPPQQPAGRSAKAPEPVVTGVQMGDLTWPMAEQRLKPEGGRPAPARRRCAGTRAAPEASQRSDPCRVLHAPHSRDRGCGGGAGAAVPLLPRDSASIPGLRRSRSTSRATSRPTSCAASRAMARGASTCSTPATRRRRPSPRPPRCSRAKASWCAIRTGAREWRRPGACSSSRAAITRTRSKRR